MASRNPGQRRKTSIGVIGYGFIGQNLVRRIQAHAGHMELAFVHARRREQAADIPEEAFLVHLSQAEACGADIIVEAAHPQFTADFGTRFLQHSDYLPLSTSALTDEDLCDRLLETARRNGTRLLLAAGALIGGEELVKRSDRWNRVRITFRKNPRNIDFSGVDFEARDVTSARTVFDGPVREIAAHFPRNVNTMVTAALLSTGVNACEGVLVADPSLDCAIAEVEAWGSDGGYFRTEKRQPAKGVSGTEMIDSVWHSLRQAGGLSTGEFELV
ncbi:MAG: DUF108 domain-containing protein [Boseongicola sp. SB0664_bin_43]|uniref:DUF108 domain-containing protein n=1 Tax=Boseongicola sp. SB0664_bin_43 TaxID=2604844 RepID=A0A6B0XXR5_9RHOB|nr:DUF108 domain-containing protein [Boseongicola sp. SB0664_bin_43]MYK33482.1 DUF108 domain-containing protein [Boseongicola sp. SB0670_bin_30]